MRACIIALFVARRVHRPHTAPKTLLAVLVVIVVDFVYLAVIRSNRRSGCGLLPNHDRGPHWERARRWQRATVGQREPWRHERAAAAVVVCPRVVQDDEALVHKPPVDLYARRPVACRGRSGVLLVHGPRLEVYAIR